MKPKINKELEELKSVDIVLKINTVFTILSGIATVIMAIIALKKG